MRTQRRHAEQVEDSEEVIKVPSNVELSLISVVGPANPGAMKLQGILALQEVTIMAVSGTSHNFVSTDAVEKLQLPLSPTNNYKVIKSIGDAVPSRGICRGLTVEVQGLQVVEDFLPLQLHDADMIFGMQWARKLGVVEFDWKLLTMEFTQGSSAWTLKGDRSLFRWGIYLK